MINSECKIEILSKFNTLVKQDDEFLRFLNLKIDSVDKDLSPLDETNAEGAVNENKAFDNTSSRMLQKRSCPLSGKGAPTIDYKNINLLRRYITEKGKILPSRVTQVSTKKQKTTFISH